MTQDDQPSRRGAKRPRVEIDLEQARALVAAGKPSAEAAREMGVPVRLFRERCAEAGITLARPPAVRAAVASMQLDSKSKRAALAADLLDDARRLREELWLPCEYIDHGGRDYHEVRWTRDTPTYSDKLAILKSVSIAVTRANDLEEVGRDSDDAGVSLVSEMMVLLREMRESIRPVQPPPPKAETGPGSPPLSERRTPRGRT